MHTLRFGVRFGDVHTLGFARGGGSGCAASVRLRPRPGSRQPVDGPDGEVFGLLGSNGAGKTTVIRCIAGPTGQVRRPFQARSVDRLVRPGGQA
ncbi:ATP-binding cassette domain-containing protein [Streptomyces sp. NPDC060027]|uniref:ATP-binding cassette domain-containing protein n=1 Tax=Streptomyces sp. NPDC060027 TaxID=3347040 RepID=UPI0036D1AA29